MLFHIRVEESFLILYITLFTFQNFSNKVFNSNLLHHKSFKASLIEEKLNNL